MRSHPKRECYELLIKYVYSYPVGAHAAAIGNERGQEAVASEGKSARPAVRLNNPEEKQKPLGFKKG